MISYYRYKMNDDTEFKNKRFLQRLAWCLRHTSPMADWFHGWYAFCVEYYLSNEVACKNCKYFHTSSSEHETPGGFYRPHAEISYYDSEEATFRNAFGKPVLTGTIRMDAGFLAMCCHPSCFTKQAVLTPVQGKCVITKRINGQGILNKNNNCKLFKRDWWRFWA